MQGGTEIINGFFLEPMMVRKRQCIVVMHESSLVLRVDKFEYFIVQLGEMQVEILDGFTFLVGNIIVFP
jgi:hypothetical protein